MVVTHKLSMVYNLLSVVKTYDNERASFLTGTQRQNFTVKKNKLRFGSNYKKGFGSKHKTRPDDCSELKLEGSTKLLTSCKLTIFSLLPRKMPNDEGGKNIFIYSLSASKHPTCNLDILSQIQTL